jgi:hypothetical protein
MTTTKTKKPLTDEQFIHNPSEWPRWPLLPLFRKTSAKPNSGFMYAGEDTRVYLGNVWELAERKPQPPSLESLEQINYNTLAELLREWRID